MNALVPLEEAQTRLLALARPLPVETLAAADAAGRWSAEDILAQREQPALDLSAMDGYAVRHADLPGPLTVIGQSAAGNAFDGSVGQQQAVRIFTGAAVPAGADTVVIQEDCRRDGNALYLTDTPPPPGRHIRRRGNDFRQSSVLVPRGQRLTPARLGVAVMGGHGAIAVHRPARVAIISTGDELVPAGQPVGPHQIPSSNGPMLKALVLEQTGAQVTDFGITGDNQAAIKQAIDEARSHDVIITIGGASVGDLDLVKPALDDAGARLDFIKAALRPGKPLMAGTLGDAVVLGLPGNPVSAFVTATLFALPLVRHLMGAANPLPPAMIALAGNDLPAGGSRTAFIRARMDKGMAVPLDNQDSAALAALARADVLIRRDAGCLPTARGAMISILPIG